MNYFSASIESAKRDAQELLRSYNRPAGSPIDALAIAGQLGITIREEVLENDAISGFLRLDAEGNGQIVLNRSHSPARKRFTVAHELGHFRLHSNDRIHIDDVSSATTVHYRDSDAGRAIKLKEIEANQFAAELLMPTDEIQSFMTEELGRGADVEACIEALANKYKVSVPAMTIKVGACGHT
jgi:Zn-dependent peptidase ImmA (M78 family)